MRHSNGGKNFDRFLRSLGPMVAAAAVGGIMSAARKNGGFKFDWDGPDFGCAPGFGGIGGVPLEELDMGGDCPGELVLAGADHVVVTEGDDFTISVQGSDEAKETLRFRIDGGALHVMSGNTSDGGEGIATVHVTMPAPSRVTIAGSGQLAVSGLARVAEIRVAGSGQISVLDMDVETLDVTIAGSGHFTAGGKAETLNLSVAGSGRAKMSGLEVANADVDIAGSGRADFACDGEVTANIMGSGKVKVRGSARCQVHSMGSGCLVVKPRKGKAA